MEDQRKIASISAPAENPRQWLTAYLHTRAHLASCESDFQCDPACTRPGCRNQDLQVQASVVDLLGAAMHLGEPVSAIYRRYYSLGLFAEERDDWLRMVALKLQKPCPFLANDLCGIYPVRPLPCILFPEYLVWQGTFAANAGKDHFRDYLCLKQPILLSPERAKVMGKLMRMWERESLISSFYLFNHGPCRLDFGNLTGELLQAAAGLSGAASAERPETGRSIPHQVLERFFLEHIAKCPPFAGVSDKIDYLHNLEGQARFLQLLQDDLLLRKLKRGGDDRVLVFRFAKGKLQAKKRSLSPAAYKNY
ncbi:MAG: YkgJ family cysteine cluster protein [Deltaproteobacteria bacterium]|nr:YkgJ family cysteine cluster protein [Deltaproteobacteria bacterium]